MNVESVSRTALSEWSNLSEPDASRASETTFAQFVERQSRFVFQIAYAVLRNVQDAEDVVQDTFLKLFRTGAWKRMQDERSFLARAAWRLAVDKLPRQQSIVEHERGEVASGESGPEGTAMAAERSRAVHRMIDALPERLRIPLALSSIEEMSTIQIAAAMDLPEGTVRRLLVEARNLVKEKMLRMENRRNG